MVTRCRITSWVRRKNDHSLPSPTIPVLTQAPEIVRLGPMRGVFMRRATHLPEDAQRPLHRVPGAFMEGSERYLAGDQDVRSRDHASRHLRCRAERRIPSEDYISNTSIG